jgi:hypothetical protein
VILVTAVHVYGRLHYPPFLVGCRFLAWRSSAGYVQDGICGLGIASEHFYCLGSWQEYELDLAALGLALHFIHHRQAAVGSGADDEPMTFPRDLLLY